MHRFIMIWGLVLTSACLNGVESTEAWLVDDFEGGN